MKNIFYGWWIVLAAAFMSLLAGGTFFYGFTVFFNPIRLTFGWTAAATSVAYALRNLESGFLTPVVGILADRVHPRKLLLIGWVVAGLGFLLMSRIDSLWAFYGSFLTIAVGFSFGSWIVLTTVVAKWFNKKRSRAFTLIGVGYGLCGVLAPLMQLSISNFGWRTSLVIIGAVIWVIGLPLCFVIRGRPSKYGYLPDGDTATVSPQHKETRDSLSETVPTTRTRDSSATNLDLTVKAALKTKTFWLLSLAFLCQHMAISALMVHIVPYLESEGFSSEIAAMAVTGLTLATLIGRLGFGFIGDVKNKRYLIAIALLLQAIGVFVFSYVGVGIGLVILSVLLYSTGFGGTLPLIPAIQADYFGTKNFGAIMGFMSLASLMGSLISPVLAGWFFDSTGSYHSVWQLLALTTIPAIPLVLAAKSPKPYLET